MTTNLRYHLRTIMWFGLSAVCGMVLTLAGIFLYLDPQLPPAESYRRVNLETPLRIYSADKQLLAEFGERRSIPVKFADIPEHFKKALLDTEDKRFYEHSGIDFISLLNDTVNLLLSREISSGASTITMQLSRNISLSLEQTFIRKFKEMLLALKIEQELTKDEILELYINAVPYGKRAYGAQAAAFTYYGKGLEELSLAQLAMLAGIPQAPSAGNPINGPERALRRRNLVLARMREQGSITDFEYETSAAEPLSAKLHKRELDVPAPFAAEWVRSLLARGYPDLYTAGYEVHTTIKAPLQARARQAVRAGLMDYDQRHGYRGPEANLLAQDTTPASELAIEDGVDVEASLGTELEELALARLRTEPSPGSLAAAVVLAADEKAAQAILGDGTKIELTFASVEWARPYESVNVRGAPPTKVTDVLSVGDLIRVRPGDALQKGADESSPATDAPDTPAWQLSQVPEVQGALVSMDPSTGAVQALVGGFDFSTNQFNHALQAARQPGSSFKPFVYSAALGNGVTPASVFMDAPLVFDDAGLETQYRPGNDNRRYNGPTRLREALYRSINLVSIRVMLDIGADAIIRHVKPFGFNTDNFPKNTQLAIGGGTMAVTPLQSARAYAVFANGGYRIEPHVLERVVDRHGNIIRQSKPTLVCSECQPGEPDQPAHCAADDPQQMAQRDADGAIDPMDREPSATGADDNTSQTGSTDISEPVEPGYTCAARVLDERNAYIMNSMLSDVVRRGTGNRAWKKFQRSDLGGKTGTTNDAADTWFSGFNQDVVTTVWVGFSDFDPLGARAYGSNTPLPIWNDYMQAALENTPVTSWQQPPGIAVVKIDPESGEAVTPNTSDAIFEYFYSESAPKPPSRRSGNSRNPEAEDFKAIDIF